MGKVILRNPSITVNSVDLSDQISRVTINTQKDRVEVTTFGAEFKEYLSGLGDATIQLDFFQNFDAAEVDATLWPIYHNDTVVPIVVKPTSAAVGATNPSYTMQGSLQNYDPLNGQVGQASTTSVTFNNADQTGLVRAVS